jgi:glycine/D-amino acid oxidase-like deaminating enzyme
VKSGEILIAGQGLAGTVLAWAMERAGLPFVIADPGHGAAATRAAAGIMNPVTGQRLTRSWRVDRLMPEAVAVYREMERELGEPLIRPMRVRRLLGTARERERADRRLGAGELSPYVRLEGADLVIEPAWHVDLPRLIAACRRRWQRQGRLRETPVGGDTADGTVSWCRGAGEVGGGRIPLERVRGVSLVLAVSGEALRAEEIRHDGRWILPLPDGSAQVGATYERGIRDLEVSVETEAELREAAARLLGRRAFAVTERLAGWRVGSPDLRPAAGWLPGTPRAGVINGLGSKGALVAPWLAAQWVAHLRDGLPFDPETDAARRAMGGAGGRDVP